MRRWVVALLLWSGGVGTSTVKPAGTVLVSNMQDNTVTLVDVATGTPRATLPTGLGPHEVAASADGKLAIVTNYGDRTNLGNSLTLIDVPGGTVLRTIDLGEYRRPHGAKFLPGDTLLVVTSEVSQAVVLVDIKASSVIGTISTERPLSHMLAVSADARVLYTTNVGDGSISRIDLPGRANRGVTAVARRVEGIAITPDGRRVWVGSNQDSIVVVVDADRGVAIDTIRGFGMPYRIGITPDGRTAIVADPLRGEVRIIDAATRRERQRVQFPGPTDGSAMPQGVSTSADSRLAFVTLEATAQVAAIELETGAVLWKAAVGASPDGIAYAPSR